MDHPKFAIIVFFPADMELNIASENERICVIGAGPGGMSTLFQWQLLKKEGLQMPEIVCYEKQAKWGGQFRYDERTG